MSEPIDLLLPKLANVRQTASDRWLASCTTANHEHGDRHPSLSIRVCDDNMLLIKCRSMNCDAREIMHAIGLELRDLFPRRIVDRARVRDAEVERWNGTNKPRRDRLPARDALAIVLHEAMVVLIAAKDMRSKLALSNADFERLAEAVRRISEACDVA